MPDGAAHPFLRSGATSPRRHDRRRRVTLLAAGIATCLHLAILLPLILWAPKILPPDSVAAVEIAPLPDAVPAAVPPAEPAPQVAAPPEPVSAPQPATLSHSDTPPADAVQLLPTEMPLLPVPPLAPPSVPSIQPLRQQARPVIPRVVALAAQAGPQIAERHEPAPPASAPPAVPAPPVASSNGIPTWRGELMARLRNAKRYPDTARARGEQGIAMVSFTMDRAGHVVAASLARSSGSPLLDNEAVALIRRAEPLPAMPEEIAAGTVNLTVPVTFALR